MLKICGRLLLLFANAPVIRQNATLLGLIDLLTSHGDLAVIGHQRTGGETPIAAGPGPPMAQDIVLRPRLDVPDLVFGFVSDLKVSKLKRAPKGQPFTKSSIPLNKTAG
jgi:hypothetical protein